jgi:hypothetical protein
LKWIAPFPKKMDVMPTAGGEYDERAEMDRVIESNQTYLMDCGQAGMRCSIVSWRLAHLAGQQF